jgi:alpha-galactosidase
MFTILGLLLVLLVPSIHGELFRAPTPPMGWNSYNAYTCDISEDKVKMNAQALVNMGLKDLGYNLVTTDCAWNARERDSQGRMQWNASTFPSGGKALGDFLHARGLKFGMYSGAGYKQCNPYPITGSRGKMPPPLSSTFVSELTTSQTTRISMPSSLPSGVLIPSSMTTVTWQTIER